MKKSHSWSPEETDILNRIINEFQGSPSAAYQKHPEWKAKLKTHSDGAIWAKIHYVKNKGRKAGPQIAVETTPRAAMTAPRSRLTVVKDGELQRITCPNCQHEFNVIQQPA